MKLRQAGLALALALVAGSAVAGSNDSAVKIVNSSSWDIHQMFLSTTDTEEWGPDQLGENVIPAEGGSFTLHSIPCAEYDIRIVDEDGDACEVREVGMCASSGAVEITDEDLLDCQVETEQ